MDEDVQRGGWGWPANARKCHWFDPGEIISVCRKWMYSGIRQSGQPLDTMVSGGPDDCRACVKILLKRKVKV